MVKLTVTTDTGYEGTILTQASVDGTVLVKVATKWRGLPTPGVVLKSFVGEEAERRADRYAIHLKAAILDTGPASSRERATA